VALAVALVLLALPGAAGAVGPFTLAEGDATSPDVIVDAAGTAHVVWTHEGSGNPTPITYCQVPRGAGPCALTRDIAFPGLSSLQGPHVFLDGATIRVVAQRFDEKVYVATSSDGGDSFDVPTAVGEPPLISPLQDAVADPGGGLYLLYAGLFQKTSFDAVAPETAYADIGVPGFAYGQSAALWPGGAMAAWSDLHQVAFRYSIGNPNETASWPANIVLDQGGFEGPVLSGTGATTYLVYEGVYASGDTTLNGGVKASLWSNSPAGGFAGPVLASDGNEGVANTLDAFVDGTGTVHVLWGTPTLGDGLQHLRYASLNGLALRSPAVTIARSDRIPAFVDGQISAAPDGEGLAVFKSASVQAATLEPVPSPPQAATRPGRGTAVAARLARVRRGRALLRLSCRGGGACRGALRLIARVRVRRGTGRRSRGSAARRARNMLIGKARFSIPAGKKRVIRVGLNRKGRRLLRRARRHRLEVRLRGRGVKNRAVLLQEVRRRRRGKRTAAAAHGSAAIGCEYAEAGPPGPAGNTLRLDIDTDRVFTIEREGAEIQVNNTPAAELGCAGGTPTPFNVDRIDVYSAESIPFLELLAPGASPEPGGSEIELYVHEALPEEVLTANGGSGPDTIVAGRLGRHRVGVNLNSRADGSAQDADIVLDARKPAAVELKLAGGEGSDTLSALGGAGFRGGFPGDHLGLRGGPGNDKLIGGPNDDRLTGLTGNDVLLAGRGRDLLTIGPGRDVARAGKGPDRIFNTSDVGGLPPDRGRDKVFAGPGNDLISVEQTLPGDLVRCGAGRHDSVTKDRGDRVSGCERVKTIRR